MLFLHSPMKLSFLLNPKYPYNHLQYLYNQQHYNMHHMLIMH